MIRTGRGSLRNKREQSPLISVVIPVYNAQQVIGRCLQSVQHQNYPEENIEIIVVDDGSTDKSADVARDYDVKVVIERHNGPGAARNRGIAEASGDIIAFIDADDVASESWLEEVITYLNKDEKIGGIGSSHLLLNKEGNFTKIAWLERYFRFNCSRERVNHLGTSGCAYKKHVLTDVDAFDQTLLAAEDMDLSNRVLNAGYTLYLIKKPLIKVQYPNSLFQYMRQQIKKVAYMVIFYLKPRSVRKVKGSYSGLADYMQGLLPLTFLIAFPFLQDFEILYGVGVWMVILLLLNTPFLRFVFAQRAFAGLTGSWLPVFFAYLPFRSLAWGAGLLYGAWLAISRLLLGIKGHMSTKVTGGLS